MFDGLLSDFSEEKILLNVDERVFIAEMKDRGWSYFERPNKPTGQEFLFKNRKPILCWSGRDSRYESFVIQRDTSLLFHRDTTFGSTSIVYNNALKQAFEFRGILISKDIGIPDYFVDVTVFSLVRLLTEADNILGKPNTSRLSTSMNRNRPVSATRQAHIWRMVEKYALG
jgi:hypothetical protein